MECLLKPSYGFKVLNLQDKGLSEKNSSDKSNLEKVQADKKKKYY
jgi:hypothetical protein